MDIDSVLRGLYYTPGLPTSYGGFRRLYTEAKRVNSAVTREQVREWLLAQDTYTLHRRARKKLSAEPRVYVKGIDEQWSMDLCDVSNVSSVNDDCNFILTCVDVFSKWGSAEGVRRKSGPVVTRAMEALFARTERRPQRIETDQGKEFWNRQFRGLCSREGIHHFSTQSSNKAATVERFNRSLKELMYKHFTAQSSARWIEVLPQLLETYNHRYHRSIGMSPSSVSGGSVEEQVYRRLYGQKPKRGQLYRVGDMVRISKKKHVFEKGYLPNWTEEVFKVRSVVSNHRPHRYELEDMAGEVIKGYFAPEELQKTIKGADDVWKIDKILRPVLRRGEQWYLVKWFGFPDKFNSLVRAEEVVALTEHTREASPALSEEL